MFETGARSSHPSISGFVESTVELAPPPPPSRLPTPADLTLSDGLKLGGLCDDVTPGGLCDDVTLGGLLDDVTSSERRCSGEGMVRSPVVIPGRGPGFRGAGEE